MWDPRRDCFVIYAKTWIDAPDGRRFWKRAIIRTESKDFVDWSMPQLIIVPNDGDLGQIHGASVFYIHGVYLATLQRLDFGGFVDFWTNCRLLLPRWRAPPAYVKVF